MGILAHSPDPETQGQLPTGPTGLTKQRPALAQLREAMTALHIGGVCRAVAYELLTYWSPGGTVFPAVTTLADGMGLKPRMVQYHLAHLERVGLWVRTGRIGRTNIYALHLPGEAQEGFSNPRPLQPIAPPPCNPLHPKWSEKGKRAPSGRSATPSNIRVVRTAEPVAKAAPLKGSPAPSFRRITVLATPDEAQPHIEAMREVVQRATETTSPTQDQPAHQPSSFDIDPDIEARLSEADRLLHEGAEAFGFPAVGSQHHHPNRQAGVHNADTTASWGAHATNADTTTAQAFSHQPTTTTATRTDNSMTDTLRARVLVFRVVSCRSAPPLTGLRPFSQGGVGTGVRVLMRGLGRNVGRNVGRADHTYL